MFHLWLSIVVETEVDEVVIIEWCEFRLPALKKVATTTTILVKVLIVNDGTSQPPSVSSLCVCVFDDNCCMRIRKAHTRWIIIKKRGI